MSIDIRVFPNVVASKSDDDDARGEGHTGQPRMEGMWVLNKAVKQPRRKENKSNNKAVDFIPPDRVRESHN